MKARRIVVYSLFAAILGIAAGALVTPFLTRHENGQLVTDAKATKPAPRDNSVIETGDMAEILLGHAEPAPKDFEPKEREAGVRRPKMAGDRVLVSKHLFDAPRPKKLEVVAQDSDTKSQK